MYCIIVGEIVNASKLDPDTRKKISSAIQNTFDRINTDYISMLMTSFGMVRGDGFQGVLLTQHHAPQIIQDIIEAAYSVEKTTLRISVAHGALTVTSDDRNMADGPALHAALTNLEKLKKRDSAHWLSVAFNVAPLAQALVDSLLALMTALTEGWTEKQRELVWLVRKCGDRQKTAGKRLNIPPSVVSKQLKAASYETYRQAWAGLKDYLVHVDEHVAADRSITEKSYVSFFNVGVYAIESGRNFAVALSHFQSALQAAKEELEENNPLLIPIYNKLARTSLFVKDYEKADAFISESMKLQEKMSKLRVPYADTLLIKAEISLDMKDYTAATAFFQKALDIALDVLGDSHPYIAEIYAGFAIMYQTLEKDENALAYFEMIQVIKQKYINEIPPADYATTLHNIAVCHYYARNYTKAIHCAEEALCLFEDNLPYGHEHIENAKFLLSQLKSM